MLHMHMYTLKLQDTCGICVLYYRSHRRSLVSKETQRLVAQTLDLVSFLCLPGLFYVGGQVL